MRDRLCLSFCDRDVGALARFGCQSVGRCLVLGGRRDTSRERGQALDLRHLERYINMLAFLLITALKLLRLRDNVPCSLGPQVGLLRIPLNNVAAKGGQTGLISGLLLLFPASASGWAVFQSARPLAKLNLAGDELLSMRHFDVPRDA